MQFLVKKVRGQHIKLFIISPFHKTQHSCKNCEMFYLIGKQKSCEKLDSIDSDRAQLIAYLPSQSLKSRPYCAQSLLTQGHRSRAIILHKEVVENMPILNQNIADLSRSWGRASSGCEIHNRRNTMPNSLSMLLASNAKKEACVRFQNILANQDCK